MKIVVIGGTGLIGTKLVNKLRARGHEVVPASPSKGINAVTGDGLTAALAGADIVVDVANSPSFEDGPVLEFFETSGRNLAAAEKAAGVKYHVALSVVGTDRNPGIGYLRAKLAQERLIEASSIPFTIVRATQFFEFFGAIAQAGAVGNATHLSTALMQPIAADDVVEALVDVTLGEPVNGVVEIAGPGSLPMYEFARRYLNAKGDTLEVVGDPAAGYFGSVIDDSSLRPGDNPRLGKIGFDEWLNDHVTAQ